MQPAIVNSGGLNAGVFALVARAVVIWPAAQEPADAKTRNRIVPPGGTLDAGAETVTEGLTGADVAGAEGPESVGLGLADEDEGDGEGEGDEPWRWPAAPVGEEATGLLVPLAVGEDAPAGADGAAEAVGATVGPDTRTLGTLLGDREAEAGGVADSGGDADGVTPADDATAMTIVVTPPKIRRKPVARISVTGRRCLDRMGTPRQSMPWWLRSCCTGYSSRLAAWIAPGPDFLGRP